MADLALWATAAATAFGWSIGTFVAAYQGNRESAIEVALEASLISGSEIGAILPASPALQIAPDCTENGEEQSPSYTQFVLVVRIPATARCTMTNDGVAGKTGQGPMSGPKTCQSIEWYAEGETRIVEVDGVQIVIRFVGRRGRRGRIAISAPPGTVFRAEDGKNAG